MNEHCIIVGAGHGGVQAAASLRQEAYQGRITLVSDEPDLPYHKPPLSKGFLKAPEAPVLELRNAAFYRDNGIDLVSGARVTAIAPATRTVTLADGGKLAYTNLILATGSRPRLPELDGIGLDGVLSLRSLTDARRLSEALTEPKRVVIIGGGFIGLELAHTLAGLGHAVTLIEAVPRLLARSVSPAMASHIQARSAQAGIAFHIGARISGLEGTEGKVTAVTLADGRSLPADIVILGTGALPNVELAAAAGLAVNNGIEVDAFMRSSDPAILAIGDCTNFHQIHAGQRLRLECVQNATDQGRNAARTLVGRPEAYRELPWFWSDQGDMKLQTAGLSLGADETVTTGALEDNAFAIHHFKNGRLIAVDTINRPADHMLARRLIGTRATPTLKDVLAGPQRLKEMLKEAAS
ncbi:MAG: NAD(P)/FAD-dependent oxidoreductase [Pseudomonadota bacterium]